MTLFEARKYLKQVLEKWVGFTTTHRKLTDAIKALTVEQILYVKMKDGGMYKFLTFQGFADCMATLDLTDIEKIICVKKD